MDIKYPEIECKLTGTDGNAMMLIGRMRAALRKGGVSTAEIVEFTNEAMSGGDYDNVISTCMRWVNVS